MKTTELLPFNDDLNNFFSSVAKDFSFIAAGLDIERKLICPQGSPGLFTYLKRYCSEEKGPKEIRKACKAFVNSNFYSAFELLDTLGRVTEFFKDILVDKDFSLALKILNQGGFFNRRPDDYDYLNYLRNLRRAKSGWAWRTIASSRSKLLLRLKDDNLLASGSRASALEALEHHCATSAVEALITLHKSRKLQWLIDEDNCQSLLKTANPKLVAEQIAKLDEHALSFFKQDKDHYQYLFRDGRMAIQCNTAIQTLYAAGLRDYALFETIISHDNPNSFAEAYVALRGKAELDNIFDRLIAVCQKQRYPAQFSTPLIELSTMVAPERLLKHAAKFSKCSKEYQFFYSLGFGRDDGASETLITELAKHKDQHAFWYFERSLAAGFFEGWVLDDRRNFFAELLADPQHLLLAPGLWQLIPVGRAPTWRHLCAMREILALDLTDEVKRDRLNQYAVNTILAEGALPAAAAGLGGRRRVANLPMQFNGQNSTHQQSVHKASDLTVLLIRQAKKAASTQGVKLAEGLSLTALWNRIAKFQSNILPEKKEAALRCLQRLSSAKSTFVFGPEKITELGDFLSQLITRKVIQEDENTTAVKKELADWTTTRRFPLNFIVGLFSWATRDSVGVEELWIQALYEIQRGYNLSDTGVDDRRDIDSAICPAGTLNKLCECLSGSSPYILFVYVSNATLIAKTRIYLFAHIKEKLNGLQSNELAEYHARLCSNENCGLEYQKIIETPSAFDSLKQQLQQEYEGLMNKAALDRFLIEMPIWIPDLPSLARPDKPSDNDWTPEVYNQMDSFKSKLINQPSVGFFAGNKRCADSPIGAEPKRPKL